MTKNSNRLPIISRCTNYLAHACNRLTGRSTTLEFTLASQPVKLHISNQREIRRAHAIHHELDLVERINAHLQGTDTVYDIGANIGVLTLLMARQSSNVRVFSFEPEPRNFSQLQQNITLNNLDDRVTPNQLALGASEGEVALHVRGHAGEGRHSIAESAGSTDAINVALTTCHKFAQRQNAPPDVLKIDVEGAEGQVLAGVTDMLGTHPPRDIFLEIHHKGDGDQMPDGSKIHDWFTSNSYQLLWDVERRSGSHRHYRHSSAAAA